MGWEITPADCAIILAMKHLTAIALLFASPFACAQWIHTQSTNDLTRVTKEMYILKGRYLSAPDSAKDSDRPSLILFCIPDPKADHGHRRGVMASGMIDTDAILDNRYGAPDTVTVEYRRDDYKADSVVMDTGPDLKSVFFPLDGLGYFLYGHKVPRKEGNGPQTQKLIIGLSEYLHGQFTAQFDLPDSTEIADSCGAIWHK